MTMANTLISIQILPKTPNGEDVIPYVDRAIEIIKQAGVKYEVNPLDTVMEGDYDELMTVVKQMNEAMIEMGSPSVISQVKIFLNPDGVSMTGLTEKHR